MEKLSLETNHRNASEDAEQDYTVEKSHEMATCGSSTFDFTKKSWSSDFVLDVEGSKLYVAKNILALSSPVFFKMFQSGFKEIGASELELPGKRKRDVVEFLRCIYPNAMSEISCDTVLRILPLADEFQVLQLKQRCEKVLLDVAASMFSSTEKLCCLLSQACMYNLKQLRDKCVQHLSSRSQDELEKASRKFHVPAEVLVEILEKINASMNAKMGKLQASYGEINEENETLKDYISVELKKMNDLTITQCLNWKEKLIVLSLRVDEVQSRTTKSVDIWGKSLSVSAVRKMSEEYDFNSRKCIDVPWLHLVIDVQEAKPVICSIAVRCFLVSRQRSNENMLFDFHEQMSDNKKQKFESRLVKMSQISPINQGFIRDRKISLIVQIFMSEPRHS